MRRDLVVVGASAGGVETLRLLASALPADLEASVLVVNHVAPTYRSVLPEILERAGSLRAAHARHGERFERGRIYVAPPDHHLLVDGDRLSVNRGPLENGHRPAIDPLFRSAAIARGRAVIAVVLSGTLDDGTAGALSIKKRGGLVLAQDPAEALFAEMPSSVISNVGAHQVVGISQMGPLLASLTRAEVEEEAKPADKRTKEEVAIDELDPEALGRPLGKPSGFSCPGCNGELFELVDSKLVRYRCRVGHAYSEASLSQGMSTELEQALWTALRVLKEHADFAERLRQRALAAGRYGAAELHAGESTDAEERAGQIRAVLAGEALQTLEK
jgi:two-component system chemotaxis response regulator CheB